jgi:hypothetical protein
MKSLIWVMGYTLLNWTLSEEVKKIVKQVASIERLCIKELAGEIKC